MEFTPANVGVWGTAVALEHDPGAPELTSQEDPTALRTKERRVRLHVEQDRGYYAAGNETGNVEGPLRCWRG